MEVNQCNSSNLLYIKLYTLFLVDLFLKVSQLAIQKEDSISDLNSLPLFRVDYRLLHDGGV